MSDEHTLDFGGSQLTCANPTWCMTAIELAFSRKVAGKAWEVDHPPRSRPNKPRTFRCRSVHEPDDHTLVFAAVHDMLTCDCEAGAYARPCCHAGAVLLLLAGYAPEYQRGEP